MNSKNLFRYLKIWWILSRNSFLTVFYAKLSLIIFLTGKILRFSFFVFFIYFLLKGTKTLAGYNFEQTIFFFLTFNLIDIFAQFLYREVYRFRELIVSGDFDLVLVKPLSSLFRSLMGGADIIDLITLPPLIFAIFYVGKSLNPSLLNIFLYVLLLVNGFIIATAFYISVLALGIITFEVDHTIMIYRDISALGKFPIDIYKEPLRSILTYLLPVGIMISFPVKALINLFSFSGVLVSLAIGAISFVLALRFWQAALKNYTSASS